MIVLALWDWFRSRFSSRNFRPETAVRCGWYSGLASALRIFSRFASAWTRKLLRLASFLFLGLTLQLFLELLVLHQLIGALPNFCYNGFGRVEVPSQPGGHFHLHQLLSVLTDRAVPVMDNKCLSSRLGSSFLQNEQTVRKGALKLHFSWQGGDIGSTLCARPRSSSRAGDTTTTQSGLTPRSDTSHQHQRCSCLHSPRGRLRYADRLRRPRWRNGQP